VKVALTLALALVAVAPATAGAAERQARIYGGTQVAAIADVPFQAALVRKPPFTAANGQFCGGTIRDEWHVITAAHCVFDNFLTQPGQAIDPADLDVLVGTVDLADEGPPAKREQVSAVSFEPRYGSTSLYAYDAAVLTLEDPLDLIAGPAKAATLVTTPQWGASHPLMHVSGWGLNDGAHDPDLLREAIVPFRDDASCADDWGSVLDGPVMVCAGDVRDSCDGDSGGPLSVDVDAGAPRVLRLAGIVSFGPASGCGNPAVPGVYTEIDGPVRAFVDPATTPTPAPRLTGSAAITGTAQVGDVLTCAPGMWSGSPAFGYSFMRGDTLVRATSADPTYTVQPADAAGRISCAVKATNAGGYGFSESGLSATVPTPAPTPVPAPVVTPVVPARPPVAPRPTPPADRTAPVARIAKVSCTRSRCTLDARVTDAGFSSGVRRVEVKLVSKYRTSCARGKRRVPCTRIRARALRAALLDAAGYRVRVTGLPAGRHTFTLRAVDVAGNRQAIPARRTVTTGRR
jgi:hypothetical protein